MTDFDSAIARAQTDDPFIPTPVAAEVIKELPQGSAVMSLARKVTMSTTTNRLPVLSVLPQAYWVSGDTGLKKASASEWKNVVLTAEELAVLVPIPDAYVDDSQVPIWDEVRPLLVEAIGAALDAACLFGTNKPTSFPLGIYPSLVAAGNGIIRDHGSTDLAGNVAEGGELLAKQGFMVNGFASRPGLTWNLVGLRDNNGTPIYVPNLQGPIGGNLYGYPLREVNTDAWDSTEAELIGGDWKKAIVGIRKDITFTPHTDGVISDDNGVVIFNAMQQDSTIWRAVFRAGFATANPVTRLESNEDNRYPFFAVQATTAGS